MLKIIATWLLISGGMWGVVMVLVVYGMEVIILGWR